MPMNFKQRIDRAAAQNNSLLCIGLDPVPSKLPAHLNGDILAFNKAIIESTEDLVCSYKPNSAFYESKGAAGIKILKQTCDYVRSKASNIPIILDFKRADIGNTNNGYVDFAFSYLQVDAVTVNPYLGQEALKPFLEQKEKGIIILCRTSNPGAGEFQDLATEDGGKLYQNVAKRVLGEWNYNRNCALVAGATAPDELAWIRSLAGDDVLILAPGVSAQGAEVESTVQAGVNSKGKNLIINSSRGILYASNGTDFAEAARAEAVKLKDQINKARKG